MLIPLRRVPEPGERIRTPIITVLLIVANVVAFFYQMYASNVRVPARRLEVTHGAIPRELTRFEHWEGSVLRKDPPTRLSVQRIMIRNTSGEREFHYVDVYTANLIRPYYHVVKPRLFKPRVLDPTDATKYHTTSRLPVHLSIVFSLFLHGGFVHIVSNMLYLFAFGPNIEDSMGHARFLLFYLLCGVLATVIFVMANFNSVDPLIGASGAISGVMGAHFVAFPRARIRCLFLIFIISLPAIIVLLPWIVSQVIHLTQDTGHSSVAWIAHVVGFLAGMFLIRYFQEKPPLPPPPPQPPYAQGYL